MQEEVHQVDSLVAEMMRNRHGEAKVKSKAVTRKLKVLDRMQALGFHNR